MKQQRDKIGISLFVHLLYTVQNDDGTYSKMVDKDEEMKDMSKSNLDDWAEHARKRAHAALKRANQQAKAKHEERFQVHKKPEVTKKPELVKSENPIPVGIDVGIPVLGMDIDNEKKRPVRNLAKKTVKQMLEETKKKEEMNQRVAKMRSKWSNEKAGPKTTGLPVEQEGDVLMEGRKDVWHYEDDEDDEDYIPPFDVEDDDDADEWLS